MYNFNCMKIIIVGAGFTGIQLAKRLINGKNDVVLVDNDEETVRHAANGLDCEVLHAEGNNLETLEQAGIKEADAIVCVTASDEINMITCSLVNTTYPDVIKIARVRNYAYYVKEKLETGKYLYGIDYMIHPDVEAAEAIVNAAKHGAVTEVIPFGDDYELLRVTVEKGSRLEGEQLMNVRKLTDRPVIIAYVESDGETTLPSGTTVFKEGDTLGVLLLKQDAEEFFQLCGTRFKRIRKVGIVGASRIGLIVAEKLIKRRANFFKRLINKIARNATEFVIIDSDEEKAKMASEKFPDVRVYNADAADEYFIKEEGIQDYDLMIYTTQNYELNIVMAAYVESLGVENSIALVYNSAFGEIARNIGIEVPVPIRDTVIDSIMSHLRGKAVTSLHTISEGDVEIAEITLTAQASVIGKSLREIAENGKFLILMIQKNGNEDYEIPVGSTVLEDGDNIVVVLKSSENDHVVEKFGSRE